MVLFVTFRTFDAIQNSADAHKELHNVYPMSTILMPKYIQGRINHGAKRAMAQGPPP